ncbi:unnamed protein product [Kluyveromyces dobzhanskii CBS 2104]|uniref:DNA-(apurinic or apyrimidinic site) endonuclease 2 n=1 Tax=Kluyveromyces dobzhanskii CBS 2104 TaxID=1427455 RepID=A0A0A8L962_9SACH|nr:unnamed protein product [Kluyveromyces dobzhanskii CBS 2104]
MQEVKDKNGVRFLTFNVNGVRTLFQHYPFSRMNNSLKLAFELFQADIVTLQELKIDAKGISKWGKVEGYQSYITIPQLRKGYSGVGCWVRIPPDDDPKKDHLRVVKAEEGITGLLRVQSNGVSYRESSESIGGYAGLDFTDEKQLLHIDGEGRCVIIELANNVVVFSTYCPANSTQTEDGEQSRLIFLKLLFKRIRNLHKLGKHIVLMGDINVCRDLKDHATALEELSIPISCYKTGSEIEDKFNDKCVQFIMDPVRIGRRLLNTMLSDSLIPQYAQQGILVDSTRHIQGKDRLKMYTVWNTLLNTRPANYGSRIDFIFVDADLKDSIQGGDILTTIMGSDHCPVYMDISVDSLAISCKSFAKPKFEAKTRYVLNQGNIMEMFRKVIGNENNSVKATENKISKPPVHRTSSIPAALESAAPLQSDMFDSSNQPLPRLKSTHMKAFEDMLGKAPVCQHGEETILRVSKTDKNYGKKFWVCKRSKGEKNDPEASCSFFQWK